MNPDLILALDNGTQSLRALLFDAQGKLVARSSVALHYDRADALSVELPAETFWQALCAACQQLWKQDAAYRERVAAVSLTTQRATVIALGKNDQPLRPAITWMDQRRRKSIPSVGGVWPLLFRLAGVSDTVAGFQYDCEAGWMQEQEPALYGAIHRFGLLSSYLSLKLTGQWRDAVGGQVGYLPFDFKHQRWAPDWDWKWRACPVRRVWLPEVVQAGEEIGRISAAASAETGIPAGLSFIAAAADKACEVLGSGCFTPQIACLSYGTTATVNLSLSRYVEPQAFLPAYPAAAPHYFNAEYQIYRGYWMVSWFRDQFGHPERQRASEQGGVPEQFFDDLIEAVPPGSEGLMLQPYWSPGVRDPGPEARGAVIGWGDGHTRAHLYRAIVEGIAYGLRQGLQRMEKRAAVQVQALRVAGGGSQSDGAMQITADIFNLPAERLAEFEASGLGAAINAAVGLGWHRDHASAVAAMTRIARRFEPRPAIAARYEELYSQVYRQLYKRLQPLYLKLSQLR